MELSVGMYARFVRANETYIRKITSCYRKTIQNQTILIFDKPFRFSCWSTAEKNVLKASHNILDLIEEKDLLIDTKNNLYVVDRVEGDYVFTTSKNDYGLTITLVDYQIKKIITKEEFECTGYRIGE